MLQRNTAQQLYLSLGIDIALMYSVGSQKLPQYTKKGPGRKHQQSKIKSKE